MSPVDLAKLEVVAETASTNADLIAARRRDPASWPHLSALRAEHQHTGRGRLGRSWQTPPGQALTVSLVVEPAPLPMTAWPTVSIAASLAVIDLLRELGVAAGWKWPNDVVLLSAGADHAGWGQTRKVAGILAEGVPARPGEGSDAVVLGIGLNLLQTTLPVPWATSVALAGVRLAPPEALAKLAPLLVRRLEFWRVHGPQGHHADAVAGCITLGHIVEADLGSRRVRGRAVGLGPGAELIVESDVGRTRIDSGEVRHLRVGSPT